MKRVVVVAAGVSKWGRRAATWRDMGMEAIKNCLDSNPNINPKEIDSVILSTAYIERTGVQVHATPFLFNTMGIYPSKLSLRVENMCGSGTTAIRTAWWAIASGYTDMVLCVGVEKLLIPSHEEIFLNAALGADKEWDAAFGPTPPAYFALAAQVHMRRYGTTEEQLALVSLKNHTHALKTPYAHHYESYKKKGPVTMETIMNSRPIAPPLKLYDCSTNTDGAAAVIIASEEKAKKLTDKPCLLYTSPSPRDLSTSRMPSSA